MKYKKSHKFLACGFFIYSSVVVTSSVVSIGVSGTVSSSFCFLFFLSFVTNLSQVAIRPGRINKIRSIAESAPIEIIRQICAIVGSTGLKPIAPVTIP